jgi:hypothetical protein
MATANTSRKNYDSTHTWGRPRKRSRLMDSFRESTPARFPSTANRRGVMEALTNGSCGD